MIEYSSQPGIIKHCGSKQGTRRHAVVDTLAGTQNANHDKKWYHIA